MIEEYAIPRTSGIRSGKAFVHFLDTYGQETMPGWPVVPYALADVHAGKLASAKARLAKPISVMNEQFPHLAEKGWGKTICDLDRLIDEDPLAIPEYCQNVARSAVASLKLEKYWLAEPFWSEATIKRIRRGRR